MNWQIIVGIFFLIGGVGILSKDFIAFLFGIIIGAILLTFGVRRKNRKTKHQSDSSQNTPNHSISIPVSDKSTFLNGTTLRCSSKSSKSIPPSYIVLDIETTGFSRSNDRIIEIAANKYINGNLVNQFHTYVNPGISIPLFITQLTGIRNSDVENAPAIQDLNDSLISFLGSIPIVGHNIIRFDIPLLQEQTHYKFNNKIFDTLELSKKAFPGLPSYKLSFLDQALHLGGSDHHRAGNDILITNALFLACVEPEKYQPFLDDKDALSKIQIEPRRTYYHSIDIHSILPTDPSAHTNTPLTGKNVVFSGHFSIPLDEIMQIAVDAGATLKSSVSRKVHYLVVGEQDLRFADENGMTSKSRTATKLIQQEGIDIRIIDEETFLELARASQPTP